MKSYMKRLASTLAFAAVLVTAVLGSPRGAPSGACRNIYPHHSDYVSQDINDGSYELDMSQFKEDGGYHPGKKYTRMQIIFVYCNYI